MASKAKSDILEFVIRCLINKIVNKNPGVNPLDFSGPLFFRECLLRFFNIRNILRGNYNLLGINGKYYKISNVLEEYNGNIYFNGIQVISRRIVNKKILYNSSLKNYKIIWPLIF